MLGVSSCFGGGMSHTNNACGALTGGLMAIGAARDMGKRGEAEAKQRSAELGAAYVQRFTDRFGSTQCTDLIGYDLSDPAQLSEAQRLGVFNEKCASIVKEAAEIVEELLFEQR